ncbi:MAG: transketolase [Rhizobiales bacterium]|nr:transketolase [Hyphomicrobiales bacterium]
MSQQASQASPLAADQEGANVPDQQMQKSTQMANAIRALSMDAVQAANSGHPGLPMGAADIATVLFTRIMKFDATAPNWADRDRFVLSAGHGSMLLYSCLHLLGYEDFTCDQLKNFRQLGYLTAGHPEFGHGAGIETTTGPLGQGFGNAVGMALAERIMAAQFGDEAVDHYTFVLAGDGCLMEGISQEALTLAGHLNLSKLIVLFDDNGISIDGPVSLSDSTDQMARFAASGWDVRAVDGHDQDAIYEAIEAARLTDAPSLIACKTVIGFGSPNKQGTSSTHGAPLGEEEISLTREALGWTSEPFEIPTEVRDAWRLAGIRGCKHRKAWEGRVDALDVDKKADFHRRLAGDLPESLDDAIAAYKEQLAEDKPALATRASSQNALDVINDVVPETIGGSADLTGSNNTKTAGMGEVIANDYSGRFIHYGIREHGMAAAMNGMALHGGVIPYSGTFLVFTDYCRPSIRLSALMKQRVIYVMTHDSIGLGEDGPTHQPVEHLAALRAMPNLYVFRPGDATETAECWQLALEARETPSILALTRQKIPAVRDRFFKQNYCARGAYELASADGDAEAVLFATGSELHLALDAKQQLDEAGCPARVVSVPCMELFHAQDEEYKARILGEERLRVAIEAGVEMGWANFIGNDGVFVGMQSFGASGPAEELYEHFGITADAAASAVLAKRD